MKLNFSTFRKTSRGFSFVLSRSQHTIQFIMVEPLKNNPISVVETFLPLDAFLAQKRHARETDGGGQKQ